MTPNFIAALVALSYFLSGAGLASFREDNYVGALWIFTLMGATLYSITMCLLVVKNKTDLSWAMVKSFVLPIVGLVLLMLMNRVLQPGPWQTWQWLVFWSLPLLNWAVNLYVVYTCLDKYDYQGSVDRPQLG